MNIAIIKQTNKLIDYDKKNIREQISNLLNSITEFKKINNDVDVYEEFHKLTNRTNCTGCNIADNKKYLYICNYVDFIELIDYGKIEGLKDGELVKELKNQYDKLPINNFGKQISSRKIVGDFIISKYELIYEVNNETGNTKISTHISNIENIDELTDIIFKIFVKDGMIIKENGNIIPYQYVYSPYDPIVNEQNFRDKYVSHEYEVYDRIMTLIANVKTNDELNNINKNTLNHKATLLANKPIYGDVYVSMCKKPESKEIEPPFMTLTIEQLNSIINIRGRSASLTVDFGNSMSDREYINFEKLLELSETRYYDKKMQIPIDIKGECLNLK